MKIFVAVGQSFFRIADTIVLWQETNRPLQADKLEFERMFRRERIYAFRQVTIFEAVR